jgi:hypothetical protein
MAVPLFSSDELWPRRPASCGVLVKRRGASAPLLSVFSGLISACSILLASALVLQPLLYVTTSDASGATDAVAGYVPLPY